MRPAERDPFLDLMQAAFHERLVFETYLRFDPELGDEDTLIALDDGVPVSAVQIFTRRIRLRGRTVTLGGIGSVGTHPDYERRGIATELLRHAIAEMTRRQMTLSLLFTGRTTFYERVGWMQVSARAWSVHGGGRRSRAGRAFGPEDLAPVREVYDAYSGPRELTTVRDDGYWRGQLRYAGAPDEDFRVAERHGRIVAYARAVALFGVHSIMEYGRIDGAADALASLILDLAPEEGAIVVPRTQDGELQRELHGGASRMDAIDLPDRMWRVLDRPALLELTGLPTSTSDRDLLRAVVDVPDSVYWTADRF